MRISLSGRILRLILPIVPILSMVLFCSSAANAVTFNNWSSSGPAGTRINALTVATSTPPSIYAGMDGSGVFKLNSAGSAWSSLSSGLANKRVVSLAADPDTPATLYAGTAGGGLFKSTNGGTSWNVTGFSAGTVTAIAIDNTASVIYLGTTTGGVYKGTNNGADWEPVNIGITNSSITALAISPDHTTLYAATAGGGVFKTTDGALTWNSMNINLTDLYVTALAISPNYAVDGILYAATSTMGIFRIELAAPDWAAVNNGIVNLNITALGISPSYAIDSTVIAATTTGIIRTLNGGILWSSATTGPTISYITAIAVNPSTPANMYAGTGGGVFTSINTGATWTELNTGLRATDIRAVAVNPNILSQVFAGGYGAGIFRSDDGGINWSHKINGLTNTFVQALAIDPNTDAHIYAGTANGIFTSIDSGETWVASAPQPANRDIRALAIDSSAMPATTMYAGSYGGGVYLSTDGGASWAATTMAIPNLNVTALALDMEDVPPTLYAGTNGGGVYKSSDAGGSWVLAAPVNNGLNSTIITSLALSDNPAPAANTLFAATSAGIHSLPIPGGTQWTAINNGISSFDIAALAVNPSDPNYLCAGSSTGGVFLTTNAGANWRVFNTSLRDLAIQAVAIDGASPTRLYAGSAANGVSNATVNASISVSPTTPVSFGKANATLPYSTQQLTISNTGAIDLTISSIASVVSVDDGTELDPAGNGISLGGNSPCLALPPLLSLIPGSSCTLLFSFKPGPPTINPTSTNHATLTFDSNDTRTPVLSYTINWISGIPPVVEFTSPDPDSVVRNSATTILSGTAVPNGGTIVSVSISLDAGANWIAAVWNAALSTWQYTWQTPPASGNGTYTFLARATDSNGFTTTTLASRSFTLDNTIPDTTIDSGSKPANPTNSTSADFTYSSSKPAGATFFCSLDGSAYADCTAGLTASYTGLVAGSHTFSVKAYDSTWPSPGNVDPTPATYTWTIDSTTPDTTLILKPTNPTRATDATFSFSSSKPAGATFQCSLDGEPFAVCTTPTTLLSLGEGSHTFLVKAVDTLGNTDISPASHTWTIDSTPPDITIDTSPVNPTKNITGTFTFSSTDPGATFECKIDAGTYSACASPFTTPVLTAGSHTFSVQAKDVVGNISASPATYTWAIDTTVPDTTIFDKPPTTTKATEATFTFASSKPDGATFECSLDNGAYTACTSPTDLASLAAGAHSFKVRAVDTVGNVDATPATHSWTIDSNAPDTTIVLKPANPTKSTEASFTFTSSKPTGATFECSLDGADFSICTTPKSESSLAEGSHTFAVRAIDNIGNVDASPATYSWTIDTTPPDVAITSQPLTPTNITRGSFSFASSDSSAIFECRIDAEAFAVCTALFTTAALGEGDHTMTVQAKDPAGNTSALPATYIWTIDLTPPDTTITIKPSNPTNATYATFSFSSTEPNGATFECSLDGSEYGSCTTPVQYANLTDGSHIFSVQAKDIPGNTDLSPASFSWSIDSSSPDTAILGKPYPEVNVTEATFSFSSSKAGATFMCSLDGGAYIPCTSPTTYSGLFEGVHNFAVYAVDAFGNPDPSPIEYQWIIDFTPPETVLDSKPSNPTGILTGNFSFSSTDPAATFLCSIDSGSFFGCVSPYTTDSLAAGTHTFRVKAKDPAGNINPAPVSYTWVIDRSLPDIVFNDKPPLKTKLNSARFVFSSSNPNVTFECSLDNSVFALCSSPSDYADLAEGEHLFSVKAVNDLGMSSTASYGWTIDNTPPETVLSGYPTPLNNSVTASFLFSSSEPNDSTYECSLDDGAFSPCTAGQPHVITNLQEGVHTFSVRATDTAGNIDPMPETYSWTIDLTPPAVVEVFPVNGTRHFPITGNWLSVVFSKDLNPDTVNSATFTVRDITTNLTVPGTVSFDAASRLAYFVPIGDLDFGVHYAATINGVADPAGNGLTSAFSWVFSTDPNGDISLNRRVDIADALLALQAAVGRTSISASALLKGDVAPLLDGKPNPDGIIDGRDAMVILGIVLGNHNW